MSTEQATAPVAVTITAQVVGTSTRVLASVTVNPATSGPLARLTGPSVSGTFQVGSTLTAAPGTYQYAASVVGTWMSEPPSQQGVPSALVAVGSSPTYVLQPSDLGNEISYREVATGLDGTTMTAYVWDTTPIAAAPAPPSTGEQAQRFFAPINVFNTPVVANPKIASSSAAWAAGSFTTAEEQWSAIAVKTSDGWPVYYAKSTDPIITVHATTNSQFETFHWPQGVTPSADSDGHVLIIEPDGVTETEMWQTKVSGTWPNQTVTASGVCGGFKVGLDSNSLVNGKFDSARGCGICCLAGLVMEDEFVYALKNGTAIPHALAASMPFNSPAVVFPAIDSDGHNANGVPMGTRFYLPPSVDISGLPPALKVIARTLQKYGCFICDSESGAIGIQGQMELDNNADYISLDAPYGDGTKSMLAYLPWSKMQFLASPTGA